MRKRRFFLQFENTNGLSIKNPYLNSFVCLLVFIVVSGAIESDSVEFLFHCSLYIYPYMFFSKTILNGNQYHVYVCEKTEPDCLFMHSRTKKLVSLRKLLSGPLSDSQQATLKQYSFLEDS